MTVSDQTQHLLLPSSIQTDSHSHKHVSILHMLKKGSGLSHNGGKHFKVHFFGLGLQLVLRVHRSGNSFTCAIYGNRLQVHPYPSQGRIMIFFQPCTQLHLIYPVYELHRCLHSPPFLRSMAVLIVTMQSFLKRNIPVIQRKPLVMGAINITRM